MPTPKARPPEDFEFANFAYGRLLAPNTPMALLAPNIASSTLTKVRASRVTNRQEDYPKAVFGLSADLKEVGRTSDSLKIRYTIAIETSPLIQRAELEGQAEVKLSSQLLATTGGQLGEDFASEIALQLYKLNYETIYSLFDTLSLRSPSPWLLRDVHLVR